jgi:hypothetical protein
VDAELLLAAIRTPDERAGDEIAWIEPKGHEREAAIVERFGQGVAWRAAAVTSLWPKYNLTMICEACRSSC